MAHWRKPTGENPVRTAVRFPMKLPIHMRTDEGTLEGMTENISANGLLIVGVKLPEVDSQIEFTIDMPSTEMGSENDVTIHGQGRVVRHQQDDGESKAAAVIDEYYLKA